jgi:TetR/AcrR family transcriptional repressor of nem operon
MAEALAEAHRDDGCLRGCPVGNLALEVGDRDDAIRTKLADIFTRWSGALEQWLRQGMADGELDLADPAGVARSLVAYAEGAVLLAKASNDPQLFHQIARGALALIDGAAGRTNPRPQTI